MRNFVPCAVGEGPDTGPHGHTWRDHAGHAWREELHRASSWAGTLNINYGRT